MFGVKLLSGSVTTVSLHLQVPVQSYSNICRIHSIIKGYKDQVLNMLYSDIPLTLHEIKLPISKCNLRSLTHHNTSIRQRKKITHSMF